MLHQDSAPWNDLRATQPRPTNQSIGVLAYKSRSLIEPTEADLDALLSSAQRRNRAEGVTGILVYDQGRFFQWLEGPPEALSRLWHSIIRDRRHADIEVLRETASTKRFFKAWHMGLARCKPGTVNRIMESVNAPRRLIKQLTGKPTALVDTTLRTLLSDVVIPRLHDTHLRDGITASPSGDLHVALRVDPVIWHGSDVMAFELARILMLPDTEQTALFVDGLFAQGASVRSVYGDVFEPAQRRLGELWLDDQCDDFYLTLALARLQIEVRRHGARIARAVPYPTALRSVLMSPQPGELHGVGLTMSSELFYRGGWDVTCEFPGNDAGICDLVHGRWYDALELSLSDALRRDHQLPAMRKTIVAARAASLNPAMTVIVHGRTFFERPRAYIDIGADSDCIAPPGSLSVTSGN
jgi:hypothetical protein